MERGIQDVARLTGTTSRTLRHYGDIGLLVPSRVAVNGYRWYDEAALVRLQRILLLRRLGLGLPAISQALDVADGGSERAEEALRDQLAWLRSEQERVGRQIASVESTIDRLERGEPLMAEQMFDGFDHTEHREEVTQRWGAEAYASGDRWWRAKTPEEKRAFRQEHADIAAEYADARGRGRAHDSVEAQAAVARHFRWLQLSAAATGDPVTAARFVALGDMYATDPRFAANYGGPDGAAYVRDAIAVWAAANR